MDYCRDRLPDARREDAGNRLFGIPAPSGWIRPVDSNRLPQRQGKRGGGAPGTASGCGRVFAQTRQQSRTAARNSCRARKLKQLTMERVMKTMQYEDESVAPSATELNWKQVGAGMLSADEADFSGGGDALPGR